MRWMILHCYQWYSWITIVMEFTIAMWSIWDRLMYNNRFIIVESLVTISKEQWFPNTFNILWTLNTHPWFMNTPLLNCHNTHSLLLKVNDIQPSTFISLPKHPCTICNDETINMKVANSIIDKNRNLLQWNKKQMKINTTQWNM